MKRLFVLLIAIVFVFPACNKTKTTTYKYTATITGPDLTMTVCSGGYFITVDNISGPIRFTTLPAGSGIDLTTATFPLHVKLNWHWEGDPPSPCGIIYIDAIKKAD
jgi:hypothetical protein